jgi:hypothetical protein
MFDEEVDDDDDDPFKNLVPDEFIIRDLIKANGEEIAPEEVDHGELEFNIEDILANANNS